MNARTVKSTGPAIVTMHSWLTEKAARSTIVDLILFQGMLMRFLQRLKQISTAHFPWISRANVDQLKKTIQNETRKLAWSGDSKEERSALETMRALCLALEEVFQTAAFNQPIHELLAQLKSQDDQVLALAVDELAHFWFDELCYEEKPLEVLPHLLAGNSSSILHAAVLLYLLRNHHTAYTILQSGFLHQFFADNCTEIQAVSDAYRLLALGRKPNEPCFWEAQALQKWTAILTAGIPGLEKHALNGLQSEVTLTQSPPNRLVFSITGVPINWDKLYARFGHDFLIEILRFKQESNGFIETQLSKTLNDMPLNALKTLYQTITTSVAEQDRMAILNQLGGLLNDERQKALFDARVVSAWILLATHPRLIPQLEDETLAASIQPNTLRKQHIPYAILLSNRARFRAYKKDINNAVFELCLNDLNWVVTPALLVHFYDDESIVSRCRDESDALLNTLRQCIDEHLPLKPECFIAILDVYRELSLRADRLRQFSPERSRYPTTDHELQALIIEAIFKQNKAALLSDLSWLSTVNQVIIDNTGYTEEEKKTAMRRTLQECLCFVDDHDFQERILQILNQEMPSMDTWKQAELGGMPLVIKALLNNNHALIQRFFQKGLSDAERLKQLTDIGDLLANKRPDDVSSDSKPRGERVLLRFMRGAYAQKITTRSALLNALKLYPAWYLIKPDLDGNTLLHQAVNDWLMLDLLLAALTPQNRIECLNSRNQYGNTLLHTAMMYAKGPKKGYRAIQIILEAYATDEARLAAVKERNNDRQSVLRCSIYRQTGILSIDELKLVLDRYPREQRAQAILETDRYGVNLLGYIARTPATLALFLKEIPSEALLTGIRSHLVSGKMNALHQIGFNLEALLVLLKSLPQGLRLEAIIHEHIFLNEMMDAPEIFNAVLKTLSREHRFILLKSKVERFQLHYFWEELTDILKEKIEDMTEQLNGCGAQTRRRTPTFWVSGQMPMATLKDKLEDAKDFQALSAVLNAICELEQKLTPEEEPRNEQKKHRINQ